MALAPAGPQPIPQFLDHYDHFIDGEWVPGATSDRIALLNPATGAQLATIAAGGPEDARRAVDAAARAFPAWSRTRPEERQAIFDEIIRRLTARAADYAMLETLNTGKPIIEARMHDMKEVIDHFRMMSGVPFCMFGETISRPDGLSMSFREPVGVCAQIIPWNVPLIMMAWKLAPALATGNTIVLKPSEIVSLSVMEFIREMADIIPPGVVNVLCGRGGDVGEALVTDPRVRKVSLTGSQATARKLIQYASVNIIPQSMELGGKSAMIICKDADLDAAVEGAVMSTITNKGEMCVAGSRIFVHRDIKTAFLDRLAFALNKVRVGDPTLMSTQMGPQASRQQFDKVVGYLNLAREEGATVYFGGRQRMVAGFENALFIEPTIFTDVKNSMRIAREEIFGPVTCILDWEDEADVIEQANDSPYGLAAGIWGRDVGQCFRIAKSIEAGVVWINRYYNFMTGITGTPYKGSGFGPEMGSAAALDNYTHQKIITLNLQDGALGIYG